VPDGWFIRETEWEAAQTVCLWRDASASMHWHSRGVSVEKHERAALLLLALASLLLRGGERVTMIAHGARSISGRVGLDRLSEALVGSADDDAGLPPRVQLPRHARVVFATSSPLEEIQAAVGRLAAVRERPPLQCSIRPRPTALYRAHPLPRPGARGRHPDPTRRGRARRIRRRMKAQQEGLAAICAAAGLALPHRTDHSPEAALLGLYTALTAR
jgi:uncharacterized protein (DUF58 family)